MSACENHLVSTPSCANCQMKTTEHKQRKCECGAAFSSFSRSLRCRDCKQKKEFVEKEKAKHERVEENHKAGLILVHSCISDPRNKPEHMCRCRLWVTREVAAKIVKAGECVDYETRHEFFFGAGRDILTTRKKLRAPRTRTITRPEIENSVRDLQRRLAQVPQDLREEVEEMLKAPHPASNRVPTINQTHIEQAWHSGSEKAQEERERIELYGQLTREMWQGLIREYSADEFDRIEKENCGVPVIQGSPIGADDRTAGSVGVDAFNARLDDPEEVFRYSEEAEDAPTDVTEDQETAEVCEPTNDPEAEVVVIDGRFPGEDQEIGEEDVEAA
jgi:hypothetical protein